MVLDDFFADSILGTLSGADWLAEALDRRFTDLPDTVSTLAELVIGMTSVVADLAEEMPAVFCNCFFCRNFAGVMAGSEALTLDFVFARMGVDLAGLRNGSVPAFVDADFLCVRLVLDLAILGAEVRERAIFFGLFSGFRGDS